MHCSSCFTPFNSLMDYNSIGIMSFNQSFLFFVWVSYVLTILLLLLQAANYDSGFITRFHWPFSFFLTKFFSYACAVLLKRVGMGN